MNILYGSTLGLIGALALAGTVFAQVPSSNDTSDGSQNTGMGTGALGGPTPTNLTGSYNTASGYSALSNNTSGEYNTATGDGALYENTTGSNNTASGDLALELNTTGGANTAAGNSALVSNTTGSYNAASGYAALYFNTTGSYNTASGANALSSNTTADYNTASGYRALNSNNGVSNTASGYEALYTNTTGTENTASGVHALAANMSGSNNIAEGYHAGYNLTTGSNNIDIGSPGVKAESGVIRIGTITGTTSTQSAAYIAGLYGVKTATAGTAVFIDSSGQLGTVSSSIRYKEAIQPMSSASERLLKLRPSSSATRRQTPPVRSRSSTGSSPRKWRKYIRSSWFAMQRRARSTACAMTSLRRCS